MIQKTYPNNLHAYRKKAGLTQNDVASRLGLDCTDRLSRWEHGTASPHMNNLFKLSRIYGVLPHELYADLYRSTEDDSHFPVVQASLQEE